MTREREIQLITEALKRDGSSLEFTPRWCREDSSIVRLAISGTCVDSSRKAPSSVAHLVSLSLDSRSGGANFTSSGLAYLISRACSTTGNADGPNNTVTAGGATAGSGVGGPLSASQGTAGSTNSAPTVSKRNPSPLAIQFASQAFRNNYDLVLQAVSLDARALRFASPRLKDEKKIILAAINKGPGGGSGSGSNNNSSSNLLSEASPRLKADREVIYEGLCAFGEECLDWLETGGLGEGEIEHLKELAGVSVGSVCAGEEPASGGGGISNLIVLGESSSSPKDCPDFYRNSSGQFLGLPMDEIQFSEGGAFGSEISVEDLMSASRSF